MNLASKDEADTHSYELMIIDDGLHANMVRTPQDGEVRSKMND